MMINSELLVLQRSCLFCLLYPMVLEVYLFA